MSECAVFTAEELCKATNGSWLGDRMPEGSLGIATDSRKPQGGIFLALKGERFDAHSFLADAVSNGAAALCITAGKEDKIPADIALPVLIVPDTLEAYQKIAHFHRMRFSALKMAGVTGSVGKTSVKEMLRAICIAAADNDENAVLATAENTNNQFGVPQNLLKLHADHRYAIIEMGTNHPGEIEPLTRCAAPDVAAINSIAPCHLEFLGSLYGVAVEKSAIFAGLSADGTAVIPASSPAPEVLAEKSAPYRTIRFGVPGSDAEVTGEFLNGDLSRTRIALTMMGQRYEIELPIAGTHQAGNAACAAAAALGLGIAPEVIAAGLTATRLPKMRLMQQEIRGVTYINDAYNASPRSMSAAFDLLLACGIDSAQLVLVLGDMVELGNFSANEHRKVLDRVLRDFPAARIITVGPRFGREASGALSAAPITVCGSAAGAARILPKWVKPGDKVFLKGSHAMALETVVPAE